jgi:hypothetical protein
VFAVSQFTPRDVLSVLCTIDRKMSVRNPRKDGYDAVDNLLAGLKGVRPAHLVNPSVLA